MDPRRNYRGSPFAQPLWIPAFAGMTGFCNGLTKGRGVFGVVRKGRDLPLTPSRRKGNLALVLAHRVIREPVEVDVFA